MLSRIKSYGLIGLNGYAVTVEIDVSGGMPAYETVGYRMPPCVNQRSACARR